MEDFPYIDEMEENIPLTEIVSGAMAFLEDHGKEVAEDWKKNNSVLDLPPSLQVKDKNASKQRTWKPIKSYDMKKEVGNDVFSSLGDNMVKNAERNFITNESGKYHWEVKALLEKGKNLSQDDVDDLMKIQEESSFYDMHFDKYFDLVTKAETKNHEVFVQFTPFQLAIIFQANPFLEKVYELMETNEELRNKLMNTPVKVNEVILGVEENKEEKTAENSYVNSITTKLSSENISLYDKLDDEFCNLTPIHLAVKYNSTALEKLIGFAHTHAKQLIVQTDLQGRSPLLLSVLNSTTDCTELLLQYYETHLLNHNGKEWNLSTKKFEPNLLHQVRCPNMVSCLLDRYGDIWGLNLDEDGNSVLEHFIKYDSELATSYLNQHVSTNGVSRKSDSFMIHLDLNPMLKLKTIKDKRTGKFLRVDKKAWLDEISVLNILKECPTSEALIHHPVIKTYTLLKHTSFRHFFFLILICKLIFAFCFTFLALRVASVERAANKNENFTTDANFTISDTNLTFSGCNLTNSNMFKGNPIAGFPCFFPWCIFVIIATIFKIVEEVWEVVTRRNYFTSKANYIHWFMIGCNITFITFLFTTKIEKVPDNWFFYYPAAVSLFVSCNAVINAFGMMSRVGLYIFMMREVCKKVIMFFAVYFITIVAFAMVFYLTMGDGSPFESWTRSIIKVIAMMIGEVEYSDTFETWEKTEDYFLNIIFVFFVFVVPIVINNLVIGLTVSNIEKLLIEADTRTLKKKIKQILNMEKHTLKYSILGLVIFKCFKNYRYHLSANFLEKTHDVCIKAKIKDADLSDISDDKKANIKALLNDETNNRRMPDKEYILKFVLPKFLRAKIPMLHKMKFKVPNSIVTTSMEILGDDSE